MNNAKFYTFKGYSLSRKYYTSDEGILSKKVFELHGKEERLAQVLLDNGGKWPGLNGPGESFYRVVVGFESTDHGWPLLFDPTKELVIDFETLEDKPKGV